jgi:hypothetical protein
LYIIPLKNITDNETTLPLLQFLKPSSTIRIHDEAQAPANTRPAKELSGCNPSPKCHKKAAGAFICQSNLGYFPFVVMGASGVPSENKPLSTVVPNNPKVPLLAAKIWMLKIAHMPKLKTMRLDPIFAIITLAIG